MLKALDEAGHTTPTPIQAQAIPHVLNGRDLIGIAQTGTGKTAAFALPILNHLEKRTDKVARKSCRVLVLSPTRELSGQIVESFRKYGRHLNLKVELVIGGVSMNRQIRAVQNGVDVLVATPGRLLDLVEQNALSLGRVEYLVLDEADQMLDMGFIHAIRATMKYLPKERQTLLFSATMPNAIAELSRQFLADPVSVSVTPVAKTADKIDQTVIHVAKADKQARLATVLDDDAIDRALVFTRTKHGADKVVRGLSKVGITAAAIHGNKSQNQRERTLASFRAGKIRALIATDIAARGLDIPGVSHVVNYDLPNIPESYVHRIGRTARAGAEGIAISFCDAEERAYLRDIEKLIRIKIAVHGEAPEALEATRAAVANTGANTGRKAGDEERKPSRRRRRGGAKARAAATGKQTNGQPKSEHREAARTAAAGSDRSKGAGKKTARQTGENRSNGYKSGSRNADGGGKDIAGMAFLKRPARRSAQTSAAGER